MHFRCSHSRRCTSPDSRARTAGPDCASREHDGGRADRKRTCRSSACGSLYCGVERTQADDCFRADRSHPKLCDKPCRAADCLSASADVACLSLIDAGPDCRNNAVKCRAHQAVAAKDSIHLQPHGYLDHRRRSNQPGLLGGPSSPCGAVHRWSKPFNQKGKRHPDRSRTRRNVAGAGAQCDQGDEGNSEYCHDAASNCDRVGRRPLDAIHRAAMDGRGQTRLVQGAGRLCAAACVFANISLRTAALLDRSLTEEKTGGRD